MDSPYGRLQELEEEYREKGERIPWSAANTSGPEAHTKNKNSDIELAVYHLLDQTSHFTPRTFYDPVSNELVSFARDADSQELGDYLEKEDEPDADLDSLLMSSAQRALVGDSDTATSQYGISPDGLIYAFDFGQSGHPIKQEFMKERGRGIVGMTKMVLKELGLEDNLLSREQGQEYSENELESTVADELERRMIEMANQVDTEQFKSDVESDPSISCDYDNIENYGVEQIIENIENLRKSTYDPKTSTTDESSFSIGSVNLRNTNQDTEERTSETTSEPDNKPSKIRVEDLEE